MVVEEPEDVPVTTTASKKRKASQDDPDLIQTKKAKVAESSADQMEDEDVIVLWKIYIDNFLTSAMYYVFLENIF